LASCAAAATEAASCCGTDKADPAAEITALVSLKVEMGILQAMQSIPFSPAALRHPVRHGLQTRCLQGESRAALVRTRLQAAHVAEESEVAALEGRRSCKGVTGEMGEAGSNASRKLGGVLRDTGASLDLRDVNGDSSGVSGIGIFFVLIGVFRGVWNVSEYLNVEHRKDAYNRNIISVVILVGFVAALC
jgi:hypothetical protein